MSRRRSKLARIYLVAHTLERNQGMTGLRSWEIHDPDLAEWYFTKRDHKLKHRPSKTGLNRNRKPRVEIC